MIKMQYRLTKCIDIIDPETEETIDSQIETEYFDRLADAEKEIGRHTVGEVVGEYADGAKAVLACPVEVSYEPEEVEYL